MNEFINEFYFDETEARIGEVGADEFGKWQVTSFVGLQEPIDEDDDISLL